MRAVALRLRLDLIVGERCAAAGQALDRNAVDMDDLQGTWPPPTRAFVGVAATEITTFRTQLGGPPLG
jgi:hypothetical protein